MLDEDINPTVVKIGGSLIKNADELAPFWRALQQLREDHPVVLVHGGGAQATEMARRLEHEPRIVKGRRVTSDLDLDIVLWTMCGKLNTRLVAQAGQFDLEPVGITGADAGTVRVHKRPPWTIDGERVDFGWVGDVEGTDTALLASLLDGGFFPIVAPLGIDDSGQVYNVNADTVACTIARTFPAARFLMVTDSGGVQKDVDDPNSRLDTIDRPTYEAGLTEGWIQGGMQVKLHTAFEALDSGVDEVFILAPDDLARRKKGTKIVE